MRSCVGVDHLPRRYNTARNCFKFLAVVLEEHSRTTPTCILLETGEGHGLYEAECGGHFSRIVTLRYAIRVRSLDKVN